MFHEKSQKPKNKISLYIHEHELSLMHRKVEDTKGVMRSHNSMKNKHDNDQIKRNKKTNNGQQNTRTQQTL